MQSQANRIFPQAKLLKKIERLTVFVGVGKENALPPTVGPAGLAKTPQQKKKDDRNRDRTPSLCPNGAVAADVGADAEPASGTPAVGVAPAPKAPPVTGGPELGPEKGSGLEKSDRDSKAVARRGVPPEHAVARADPDSDTTGAALEIRSDAAPADTCTAGSVEATPVSVEPSAEASADVNTPDTPNTPDTLGTPGTPGTPASVSGAYAVTTVEDGGANVAAVDFVAIVEALGLPDHIPELLEISEIQSCDELLGMEPEDLAAALGVEDEQAELLMDHCRGILAEVDAGADCSDDEPPCAAPPPTSEPVDAAASTATPSAPALTTEQKAKFNGLVADARAKMNEGQHPAALALYEASQLIHSTEKVQRRMAKLREIIDTMVVHADGFVENKVDGTCWLDDEFTIPAATHGKLFPHQREGVKWFWGLHREGSCDKQAERMRHENGVRRGGILGDDMGLGKTVQVATFLAGVLAEEDDHAATALLVMPVSLLANWEKELKTWAPELRVETFHGSSKVQRGKAARAIRQNGGVLLTTYGLVTSATAELNGQSQAFEWDYMMLDEGHKIKRHTTKVAKKCREVQAQRRFILTGTPVQNCLEELWCLFDFVAPNLLGTLRYFKDGYATPIGNGTLRNATEHDRQESVAAARDLQEVIGPYFLRREKKQVFGENVTDAAAAAAASQPNPAVDDIADQLGGMQLGAVGAAVPEPAGKMVKKLPEKVEFVCWVFLAQKQLDMYRNFVESEKVQEALNSTKSPLAALTVLKKICDHPRLLANYGAYREALGLDGLPGSPAAAATAASSAVGRAVPITPARSLVPGSPMAPNQGAAFGRAAPITPARSLVARHHGGNPPQPEASWQEQLATSTAGDDVHTSLIQESGKLKFALELLERLHAENHRVLLFSQSKQMLNMICKVIKPSLKYLRLDGGVTDPKERQRLVEQYNTDPSIFAFFLTTQVGGVGLTLTGADRVIIYDPSWNPSTDAQAVDRAYRIGQKKRVIVYRLVSCGSVEEKIYRKQVFKKGLSDTVTQKKKSTLTGYFTKHELKALFCLEDDGLISSTQKQLAAQDGLRQDFDAELASHASFLESLSVYGLSNHSLLFNADLNKDAAMDEDSDAGRRVASDTVRIEVAQDLIGGLIGRAGGVIKKIRTVSGAVVELNQEGTLVITGTPSQITSCRRLVEEVLDNLKANRAKREQKAVETGWKLTAFDPVTGEAARIECVDSEDEEAAAAATVAVEPKAGDAALTAGVPVTGAGAEFFWGPPRPGPPPVAPPAPGAPPTSAPFAAQDTETDAPDEFCGSPPPSSPSAMYPSDEQATASPLFSPPPASLATADANAAPDTPSFIPAPLDGPPADADDTTSSAVDSPTPMIQPAATSSPATDAVVDGDALPEPWPCTSPDIGVAAPSPASSVASAMDEDFYSSESDASAPASPAAEPAVGMPSLAISPSPREAPAAGQFDLQAGALLESSESEGESCTDDAVGPGGSVAATATAVAEGPAALVLLPRNAPYLSLDGATRAQYEAKVAQAVTHHQLHDIEACLGSLLDALEICDEELWLHKCCLLLSDLVHLVQ